MYNYTSKSLYKKIIYEFLFLYILLNAFSNLENGSIVTQKILKTIKVLMPIDPVNIYYNNKPDFRKTYQRTATFERICLILNFDNYSKSNLNVLTKNNVFKAKCMGMFNSFCTRISLLKTFHLQSRLFEKTF